MSFIEDDHPFEVFPGPIEELVKPGRITAPGSQGRIGDEKDALAHSDRNTELPLSERLHVDRQTAERRPVAARIFEQRLVFRYPDVTALAAHPAVKHDRGHLPALPGPSAIAKEVAHAITFALADGFERTAPVLGFVTTGEIAGVRARGIDQRLGLSG